MHYFFYIIYSSKLDRYYTGHTEDIETRLAQHNAGISRFTSTSDDWRVVYSEMFSTRSDAREREMQVKKKKSRKYIEWLIGMNN